MKKKPDKSLKRVEWDFCAVRDPELRACCYWEYARESARIRAFFSPTDSDFFPPTEMHLEIRAADGSVIKKARRTRVEPLRTRFVHGLWTHALPVKLMLDRVFGKMADPFQRPWVKLRSSFREEVAKELQSHFAENPCLTYLPFNRCSDLRDIGVADENYRCAEFDVETGIERLRVKIAWGEFTNNQIIAAFRTWVSENRPANVGRKNDKGRRKGKGLGNYLAWLGMMRLMNAYPYTRMASCCPDATTAYGKTGWPRARKKAGRVFHDLFPFLPMSDKPIHWRTAGGRAR